MVLSFQVPYTALKKPISLGGSIYMCLVSGFYVRCSDLLMAASQVRPFDHLVLVVSWTCDLGSSGTVTNGETVLSCYLPRT